MQRQFWELPEGFEGFDQKQWSSWHEWRAKELGGYYDEGLADKHTAFFSNLQHTKGKWAGEKFEPLPWQEQQIIRPIYGYLRPDGLRMFRTVFIAVPKKNGKSEIAAGIALDMTMFDGEPGAEVYGGAADRMQASIVFNVAASMVRREPALSSRCRILDAVKRILHPASESYYQVLSSDVESKHGYNVHCFVGDEVHAIKRRDFIEIMTEGSTAAREQGLIFYITTAGWDRSSIAHEIWEYARAVRDGSVEDPSFLPVLYELEEDADWEDEENWKRVNPSLGVTIQLEDMRSDYKRAKQTPARENAFRRLRLNQWTSQETRWLPMDKWDECGARGSIAELVERRGQLLDQLKGRECYAGLDLSTKTDITTFQLAFPDGERVINLPFFFVPRDNLRERGERDRALYESWARYGFVELTDGNVTDYSYLRKRLNELRQDYKFKEIAYDDWNAGKLEQELGEDGFTMIPVPQSVKALSPATKELLALVLSGRLDHGGNPVMRYMADNLVVEQDTNERIRPTKAKSSGRIDGIVALIMALDRVVRHENEGPSVYEERGILLV